ncbi:YjbH domain-containing protein [Pseudoalteromonas luteoviolacea]|uniref:Bacterial putative lipoprotein (DUF940) n=1 Tax=Pseudoalteromonas luteoviolacea (strain 2ta16) TaxID=1353533 RepID=V4JJU9_PSEL2|nr:YjbH domain-containing protein [Pseudoalteromonas luteoviolacea]ESP95142.1 bacterial putative lipoprotein (DUF940) [Pseudoalteromonas luteoviolacea 2ta16]KZN42314.1 hypothetical protein N483_12395 [Pseudoalteromonas luteoviolacea NCIMB 1944]
MSKLFPYVASCFVVVSAPSIAAEPLNTYQSFTGFTGLINTSNAEVMEKGNWGVGYNNMLDFRGNQYVDGHNFVFSAGIFDGLEVSGLVASNKMHENLFYPTSGPVGSQTRDLSFNAKYQIPLIPNDWFKLSIGSKDIGGAANNYKTNFAVASKEWSDFRFSLGLASSDHSTGLMNGAFGGVEWLPTEWFGLQIEHDAEAFNAAARLTVPKEWLFDLGELTLTSRFYSNTDYSQEDTYWAVNFIAPFSEHAQPHRDRVKAAPAPVVVHSSTAKNTPMKPSHKAPRAFKQSNSQSDAVGSKKADRAEMNRLARKLRNVLIADGFEAVRVGFNSQPMVIVSFENAVFNNNEIDALGLAAGRVAEVFSGTPAKFMLELQNHGIAMLALSGDTTNYEQFIENDFDPQVSVKMGGMRGVSGVTWVGLESANQRFLKPRVTLSPEINSAHATEFGVFDYSLALKADINVPLWRGAGFNLTAQTLVSESDDFEDKKFFDDLSEDNGVRSAFFYQTYQLPWGLYNQTKIGFFREFHKYKGLINETAWVSPNGSHKVTNTYGYFEYQDYSGDRDYHTVDYQYYWADKDVSFHVTGGKFWRKDSGIKVESRFWFGDSYVAVYGEDTNARVAGIAVNIPLSKRKNMNVTKFGQIKGTSAWRYQVGTRIGESHNKLVYQQAYQPKVPVTLSDTFFNQGRSSVEYIHNNLSRLRDAYLTYK